MCFTTYGYVINIHNFEHEFEQSNKSDSLHYLFDTSFVYKCQLLLCLLWDKSEILLLCSVNKPWKINRGNEQKERKLSEEQRNTYFCAFLFLSRFSETEFCL